MTKKLSKSEILSNSENLKVQLKKKNWANTTSMIIPSILETTDEYIYFLGSIDEKDEEWARKLKEEFIILRTDFKRENSELIEVSTDSGTNDDFVTKFPRADEE